MALPLRVPYDRPFSLPPCVSIRFGVLATGWPAARWSHDPAAEGIRRNRNDLAAVLGFIGRVVRGKRKKRWLTDVLKQAGEKADYIEAFD